MRPPPRATPDRARHLLTSASPSPSVAAATGPEPVGGGLPVDPVEPVDAVDAPSDAWWRGSGPAVPIAGRGDAPSEAPPSRPPGAQPAGEAERGDDPGPWDEDDGWVLDDEPAPAAGSPPIGPAGPGQRGRGGPGSGRPGFLRLPEGLQGARALPTWRAVVGAAVVLVVALGLVGWRVVDATRQAKPVPAALVLPSPPAGEPAPTVGLSGAGGVTPGAAPTGPSTSPTSLPGTGPGGGTPAGASVVVHVAGRVRRPGVVRLPGASRVDDALRACGGILPGADLTAVNLARPLVDGEQIVVPVAGRPTPGAPGPPPAGAGPSAVPTGGSGSPAPVDLNAADAAALDALPGVGPVLAGRILAWRAQHGRFSSVDELGEVDGVGDKTLARLRPLVRV